MLGIEWDNFNKLNKQEYIVKKNHKFLNKYNTMKKRKFYTILDLDEIQDLIDSITNFYEFKYPANMLNKVGWRLPSNDLELDSCIKLSKLLDIKQLKYRLRHDQLNFLECSYAGIIILSKRKNINYGIPSNTFVHIDSVGIIDEFDLAYLQESEFLSNIDKIRNVEDLYEICKSHAQIIDYQDLERFIHNHKDSISLRNETLNLTMSSLLYANGEHPSNGYKRAKSFMRDFNKEYKLNLNMKKLDEIMSIDYSNIDEVKRFLKSRK